MFKIFGDNVKFLNKDNKWETLSNVPDLINDLRKIKTDAAKYQIILNYKLFNTPETDEEEVIHKMELVKEKPNKTLQLANLINRNNELKSKLTEEQKAEQKEYVRIKGEIDELRLLLNDPDKSKELKHEIEYEIQQKNKQLTNIFNKSKQIEDEIAKNERKIKELNIQNVESLNAENVQTLNVQTLTNIRNLEDIIQKSFNELSLQEQQIIHQIPGLENAKGEILEEIQKLGLSQAELEKLKDDYKQLANDSRETIIEIKYVLDQVNGKIENLKIEDIPKQIKDELDAKTKEILSKADQTLTLQQVLNDKQIQAIEKKIGDKMGELASDISDLEKKINTNIDQYSDIKFRLESIDNFNRALTFEDVKIFENFINEFIKNYVICSDDENKDVMIDKVKKLIDKNYIELSNLINQLNKRDLAYNHKETLYTSQNNELSTVKPEDLIKNGWTKLDEKTPFGVLILYSTNDINTLLYDKFLSDTKDYQIVIRLLKNYSSAYNVYLCAIFTNKTISPVLNEYVAKHNITEEYISDIIKMNKMISKYKSVEFKDIPEPTAQGIKENENDDDKLNEILIYLKKIYRLLISSKYTEDELEGEILKRLKTITFKKLGEKDFDLKD